MQSPRIAFFIRGAHWNSQGAVGLSVHVIRMAIYDTIVLILAAILHFQRTCSSNVSTIDLNVKIIRGSSLTEALKEDARDKLQIRLAYNNSFDYDTFYNTSYRIWSPKSPTSSLMLSIFDEYFHRKLTVLSSLNRGFHITCVSHVSDFQRTHHLLMLS